MNAAIRAVVRSASARKCEVIGIRRGYAGLIAGDLQKLSLSSVSGIVNHGGTLLLTARSAEFMTRAGQRKAVEVLTRAQIDGLVAIGGDGTFRGAQVLSQDWKVPVVGLPASIDNDVAGSDYSIGFDTAINTALQAIDKIRDTAVSHDRVFIVEVMGRNNGFIALAVGLAAGVEAILVPELPLDLEGVARRMRAGVARGKLSSIIVVAEGAARADAVGEEIERLTGFETRRTVLGHVQRGGAPSAFDCILASRLGAAAVDLLCHDQTGRMVGLRDGEVITRPFGVARRMKKRIDRRLHRLAQTLSK
jgi:6-phosphofructokinase 1